MAFEGGVGKTEDLLLGAQTCVDPLLKVRRIEDLEHGLKWLDLILEREPNNAMAHFQTGVLCEATEQDVRAVESYRSNLAVLYHELGNHEGVREMVERALSIEEDAERRRALSELLEESGASSG
jgi:tetratricopeptide (TPR) repeat protein